MNAVAVFCQRLWGVNVSAAGLTEGNGAVKVWVHLLPREDASFMASTEALTEKKKKKKSFHIVSLRRAIDRETTNFSLDQMINTVPCNACKNWLEEHFYPKAGKELQGECTAGAMWLQFCRRISEKVESSVVHGLFLGYSSGKMQPAACKLEYFSRVFIFMDHCSIALFVIAWRWYWLNAALFQKGAR